MFNRNTQQFFFSSKTKKITKLKNFVSNLDKLDTKYSFQNNKKEDDLIIILYNRLNNEINRLMYIENIKQTNSKT